MALFATNDRRRAPRANLAAPCPSFFVHGGKRYQAFLVDVSDTGAGFRNFEHGVDIGPGTGQCTVFDVLTPYGKGTYRGTIAWAAQLEGGHAWGLHLEEQLSECDGPLGNLLDAAFPSGS